MTGGEIFLAIVVVFIVGLLFENSQNAKLANDMADKGYEEVLEDIYDGDSKKESKKLWKKVKD